MKNIFRCKFIIIFTTINLLSCQYQFHQKKSTDLDCSKISHQINQRKNFFKQLNPQEQEYRSKIRIPTVSRIDQLSVVTKIIEAIKNSQPNTKLISVDLRFYKDVDLGNLIISNLSDSKINNFLKTSKYSQGYFTLINFSDKKITILAPKVYKVFSKLIIDRGDLINSEILINVSNAKSISGNMKFTQNQEISIIADDIQSPYGLDLREASNMQFNLDKKWIMNVYSFENSILNGGKITTGFFKYLNNKNSYVKIHKFNKSKSICLIDNKDSLKFNFLPK